MDRSRAPPKEVQSRLLESMLKGEKTASDQWEYVVATNWLKIIWNSVSKQSVPDSSSEMRLSPMWCSKSDEKTFISESLWKVFLSWYPLDENYQLYRRHTTSKYVSLNSETYVMADKGLDFINMSVCRLEDLEKPERRRIALTFMWEEFPFLEMQIRHYLKIPLNVGVRLWISLSARNRDVFFQSVDFGTPLATGTLGGVICMMHRPLFQELQKRQHTTFSSHASMWKPPSPFSSLHQSLPPVSSSSDKLHLSVVFQEQGLVLTICAEEITDQFISAGPSLSPQHQHQHAAFLSGIGWMLKNKSRNVQNLEWDTALSDCLEQFTSEVQTIVCSSKDNLQKHAGNIVTTEIAKLEKCKVYFEEKKKKVEEKEKRLEAQENDLNQREQDLSAKFAKFKVSLTDFLMQKKRLEEELQRIESQNKIAESKIDLNVGGVRFTTSTVTLTREPDSVLALMFSGRHSIKREMDGSYFIDRDGTNFRHILNYLREGTRAGEGLPQNAGVLNELLVEADYYQLSGFAAILREKLLIKSGPSASMPNQ